MTRDTSHAPRSWSRFLLTTLVTWLFAQAAICIAHEFAHSTTAWLLGYTHTPFTVVWGNPVTILGWDEGVPYDQLFPGGGYPAEAMIGAMPLLMHTIFLLIAWFLWTRHLWSGRYFYLLYWFTAINLTELIAYIFMRPFAGSGDTGRFNMGLHLSPWPLFLAGSILLLTALWWFLREVTPRLLHYLHGNRTQYKTTVVFTAFILFLWGSGLRIMLLYPDRQWKFGLIGLVGFPLWILMNHFLTTNTNTAKQEGAV